MDDAEILMSNAYKKLEVAKNLFSNGYYGDAVSRSYYAMFFAAKALLSKRSNYPRTHRGLISQFGREFVKTGEFNHKVFNILTRAQEDREEADYGLLPEIGKKEAEIIIDGAEVFLQECEVKIR
ncbi:HEPN domain-containing protein [Methanobacterium petrolearium]|uniref:HEPN domain-containing protein n=1 Tax=Methanobacterium petrolearium TaxID=710190 RepID=UPI001AE45AE3|nr:HEPN domain-containing protein [Methanobacterium petrolearium]MBP1946377.1 uncharacterized protein (UPF0332 family) [Methanobacterium petrolearium]BDZ70603.1 HEPN domain-containing protein [Methanobacterium petrolearium]